MWSDVASRLSKGNAGIPCKRGIIAISELFQLAGWFGKSGDSLARPDVVV